MRQTNYSTIISHNDGIAEDYRFWSPSFNIHFGFWRWGTNPFSREAMLLQMNEEVLNHLQLPVDKPCFIVDAGCGAGATLRYQAERLPLAKFAGITLAPWLLEKGIELNQVTGNADRIELLKGDFQAMPLPEGCAEAVFCLESACYADGKDKAKLIGELYRILKPGGRLVVVDAFRKTARPMPAFFEKLFRKNASLWAVNDLALLPLFEKTLAETGFEQIKMQDISWRAAPTAMHIPFVVMRLLWNGSWRRNRYWKALLMTLVTGLLTRYMGYYIVSGKRAGGTN
ncbi:MAG: methyltransferase domain-containing protein [Bacteroidota bacterium]